MDISRRRVSVLTAHLTASVSAPLQYTPVSAIRPLVSRVRAHFASGRTRSVEWRSAQLRAIIKMTEENSIAIVQAVEKDLSRSKFESETFEVILIRNMAKHALANLSTWMQPEKYSAPLALFPADCYIVKEPVGVICNISAWNVPFAVTFLPLIGAIAAGNCCVIKPSEFSAHSAALMETLLKNYLDKEAIVCVQGGPAETQALLDEQFDHIIFTGGNRVARTILEKASKHLTPVTLELGGKNPAIVDKHAALDVAARRIVWGRIVNAGQICIAPDYVLCHKDVEEAFVEQVKKAVSEMFGPDPKASRALARIISKSHAERLKGLLDDDPAVRGEIVVGGEVDVDRRYVAPTFLRGTKPSAKVMQEEIFGPILPIIRIEDLDEGIQFIQSRPKPLALYIFSSNKAVQQKVSQQTSSGTMGINEVVMQYICPNLPFGGVGASGYGKYQGVHSFNLFSNQKAVLDKSDSSLLDLSARYPPYTSTKKFLMRKAL